MAVAGLIRLAYTEPARLRIGSLQVHGDTGRGGCGLIAALLLSFREGLEAALILGIVFGMLRRVGRMDQARTVWLGAGLAGLLSLAAGIGLHALGVSFEGMAEQLFEGTAMLLAAGVLTWMIFWMARQSRAIQTELERDVRQAALGGGRWALFSIAFLAVLREGIELALFLTAAAFTSTATATLIGGLVGLAGAAVAGWLLFATTRKLNISAFFSVTSILLMIFAAGLVAHGVHEFNEIGWVPPVVEHVWDLNPVLDEASDLGQIFKALFGYNGNPSLTEVLAYLSYWIVVSLALLWARAQTARLPALSGESGG
jgi:high-affinity iron transporter